MITEQRRLAAIVSADVAGYSRLMDRDEGGTLAALKAVRRAVIDPAIASHGGRIVPGRTARITEQRRLAATLTGGAKDRPIGLRG